MVLLRSLYRSASIRSLRHSATTTITTTTATVVFSGPSCYGPSRTFFSLPHPSTSAASHRMASDCRSRLAMGIGSTRSFSAGLSHYPDIKDPEIKNVLKDFMAADWQELPDPLIHDALKVLSKDTDDKADKEALTNVFRAAEATEEFIGVLASIKMEMDDSVGLSGENTGPLSEELVNALRAAYDHYNTYLNSFGPDEVYLQKKVEEELGRRMIHLKMRCCGLGSEWSKVSVLGTSGISGSYVEERGP